MNPFVYLREVRSEIKKVVWPTKEAVIRLTAVVITISVLVGLFVGTADFVFTNTINFFISR